MVLENSTGAGPEPEDRHARKRECELTYITSQSAFRDVTHDLQRFFGHELTSGDPKILEIQRNGFHSQALRWLRSTTPEGMKTGSYPREQRFEEAKKSAELAGVPYEELLSEAGIEAEN